MPVQFRDYYETLGVPKTATEDEIRSAFRKLARKYHPDVAKDKKVAEEKFKEINEAYEVLGDSQKRKRYDELGADWKEGGRFRPPPGQQRRTGRTPEGEGFEFHFGGTGFSDFFEQFFGRGGRSGFPFGENGFGEEHLNRGRGPARGSDIEGDILVTLDELIRGSLRTISLQKINPRT